jgi:hypothetical protein
MTAHQFCTPGWLKEISGIYAANLCTKDKLKRLTAKICYRVKSDPDWGMGEDIIFGTFFEKGELKMLNFFTEGEAFQEAEYLIAASPETWKEILRKEREFVTDLMLGKMRLELGTKFSMLEMASYLNNIFDFFAEVDLQFPDEMSGDELTTYLSKMESLRRERGP